MSSFVPRTEAELDEMFGAPEPAPRLRIFRDEPQAQLPEPVHELPGADEMADEQYGEAVKRLHEDTTKYPAFPWPVLAELAGPMCPEDLVLIAARTSGGKSLFLQNLFDAMICEGRSGLYAGLEQAPRILRIKWACLRAKVPPKLVLATRKEERGTPGWQDAMAKVQDELAWMHEAPIKGRAHFAAARRIDKPGLIAWTEWAVQRGCQFVVVDHVDRMKHGTGANSFQELSETIQLAKELAVQYRIVMLMATQVGRPSDGLAAFMPPALHELRGAGTKEEEADTVLGIYRPLKSDTTNKQLHAVRQGLADWDTVVESGTMGIQILKHRLDGPVAHKMVKLAVEHGRVLDLPERDRRGTSREELHRL
jgi:hypothetical protein